MIELLREDLLRTRVLSVVYQLGLPQCYIAAGFVRNMVWDHLHGKPVPTPLNDVDVIYYDSDEVADKSYLTYEAELKRQMPEVNWQVRNQASMHLRNGDEPYLNSVDAMGYWPEKETGVAVRLLDSGQLECVSAFGFDSLFELKLTHNPKRSKDIFENRVQSKGWLSQWPMLKIVRN